jgi:hypothetical protein
MEWLTALRRKKKNLVNEMLYRSRRMKWTKYVGCIAEMRNASNISVRKSEGKRPLGRSRRKWEEDISRDLEEIPWEGVFWMNLA